MSKKIVICCDGTWKAADDQQVTNVVRLLHALKPSDSDGAAQVAYYDAGVGTESRTRRIAGGLFGIGLGTKRPRGLSLPSPTITKTTTGSIFSASAAALSPSAASPGSSAPAGC